MSDLISRRAVYHVLDCVKFINDDERRYAFSLMEQIEAKHEQTTHSEQGDSDKLGVKTGETCIDTISRQAAIDALDEIESEVAEGYGFQYEKWRKYFTELPSAQPERTCVNCGRTMNNGGWYADGGTRCPIEEHYALPKDGYCHLWEKRNVTDDDYPERQKNEQV